MVPLVVQVDALCLGKTNLFMQEKHKPNKIKNKRKNHYDFILIHICVEKNMHKKMPTKIFLGVFKW